MSAQLPTIAGARTRTVLWGLFPLPPQFISRTTGMLVPRCGWGTFSAATDVGVTSLSRAIRSMRLASYSAHAAFPAAVERNLGSMSV